VVFFLLKRDNAVILDAPCIIQPYFKVQFHHCVTERHRNLIAPEFNKPKSRKGPGNFPQGFPSVLANQPLNQSPHP